MNSMPRRLLLNVTPITIDEAKVRAGVLDYLDRDQLDELWKNHRTTHVFRRDGGTKILCVPVVADAPDVGKPSDITLNENLPLCAFLVRNALLNYLHGLGRKILYHDPIEFIADGPGDNLLAAALPSGTSCPPWLAVRPRYELAVRVIHFDGQDPFIAMAMNLRTTRTIDQSCGDFLTDGFSLGGYYVGHYQPHRDPRLAPKFELLGRIRSIVGDTLSLDDAREGFSTVKASDAYLLSRDAFDPLLVHAFGNHAVAIKQALTARLSAFRLGPSKLERIRTSVRHFEGLNLEALPGVKFRVLSLISEAGPAGSFPQVLTNQKPVYVFDPTGDRTDTWHDRGLETNGPYDAQTFTPTRPRICVICQRTRKGQVEQFLHKFLRGIPAPASQRPPFVKGFVRKYYLEDADTTFFLAENSTHDGYQKAAREALEQQDSNGARWDIAMVQIDEAFHGLAPATNPYLVTKAAFLSQQIPVQEFEIETTALQDRQLGYVLNNMALATYAKLGGIPWRLKANRSLAHELVIGLGSASIGEGRLGDRERVVGITTVFSGDGYYWLSNLSRCVPLSDYKDALLSSLKKTVQRIKEDMNWQPRERIRIVFHTFKPFRDIEAEAVKELMAGLGDYDVEYAFIHVIEDHPYLLFDERQGGVQGAGSALKGALAPLRGQFLRLSNHQVLMTLVGASELKRPDDGMPFPLLLQLHRASTFHDTTYLARQVYAFSCHSWRTFFPAAMPVTILYSQLIASLLGQLAQLPRWNPDVMLDRIGRTRWFL